MIVSEYPLATLVALTVHLHTEAGDKLSTVVKAVRILNYMDTVGRFVHIINDDSPLKFITDASSMRLLEGIVDEEFTLTSEEDEVFIYSLFNMIFIT